MGFGFCGEGGGAFLAVDTEVFTEIIDQLRIDAAYFSESLIVHISLVVEVTNDLIDVPLGVFEA